MIKERRPRRGLGLKRTTLPQNIHDISGDDSEEAPMLATTSMKQSIKPAFNSRLGHEPDRFSHIKAKRSQQKPGSEGIPRNAAPRAKRDPIPRSMEEAGPADTMLVEMKAKGHAWSEIEEAWEKETGKVRISKSLSLRYYRIMANLANTRLGPAVERDGGCSLAYTQLEPDDVSDLSLTTHPKVSSLRQDELLAAEAKIEENFQREKANIIAEIEENYQSEKWNLVADDISRTASAHYSAELIQTHYERLTRNIKVADARDEDNHDSCTDVPRRTTRTVRGRKTETTIRSRSGVRKLDGASNTSSLPKPQQATIIHGKKSARTSRADILEIYSKYGSLTPRSLNSKKRKLDSYSDSGYAQARADRQGPFVKAPAPLTLPTSMPRQTSTNLPPLESIDEAAGFEDVSVGPFADEPKRILQKVREDESQPHTEQRSARMRRVWAERRAQGKNGRIGGLSRVSASAKKVKRAIPSAAPSAGISLIPAITYQSGPSPDSSANRAASPAVIEKEVSRDDHQKNKPLEQIMFATSQTDAGPEPIKLPQKVKDVATAAVDCSLTRHSMAQRAIRAGNAG